jgi:hypothetical protein
VPPSDAHRIYHYYFDVKRYTAGDIPASQSIAVKVPGWEVFPPENAPSSILPRFAGEDAPRDSAATAIP